MRSLMVPFFCLVAFVSLFTLSALDFVGAEDAKNENPTTWDASTRWGFKWTRPDAPEWGFIPEKAWEKMFTGGKPDDMVCGLVKYAVPGGQWGKDEHKIRFIVFSMQTDGNYKFNDTTDLKGADVKKICEFRHEDARANFKDHKNEKKPYVNAKYKFEKKVHTFSFTGVHKESGQTQFIEQHVFKGNSKYSFRVEVDCPGSDERAVRIELDRVLNMIVVDKPGK